MLKLSTYSLLTAASAMIALSPATPATAGPGCGLEPPQVEVLPLPPEAPETPVTLDTSENPTVELPQPPADPAPPVDVGEAPLIQVALLLDTSNSMDGLITQAKAQLWTIVNRFARAKRDGVQPRFQIALFEYGNTSLPAEEGYLRQVVGFTDDLDAVSAALFGLTTNGGDEYCGQVIGEALHRLPWSDAGNDFKAIYIAGNEPFTQGQTDYKTSCEEAASRGILVNTIHCGSAQAGEQGMWLHGAQIAGGSYLTINQDRTLSHIVAPQDEALALLNTQLNRTYLPYGTAGGASQLLQAEMDDANRALSPAAAADRVETKANALYENSRWDLVDAYAQEGFDLASIADEDLPEAMRGMTLEEKTAHIEELAAQRAEVQSQINELARARAQHVAAERERQAQTQGDDLGSAVTGTVDEQLDANGFEVEEP